MVIEKKTLITTGIEGSANKIDVGIVFLDDAILSIFGTATSLFLATISFLGRPPIIASTTSSPSSTQPSNSPASPPSTSTISTTPAARHGEVSKSTLILPNFYLQSLFSPSSKQYKDPSIHRLLFITRLEKSNQKIGKPKEQANALSTLNKLNEGGLPMQILGLIKSRISGDGGKFSGGFDINIFAEVDKTGDLSLLPDVSVELVLNLIEDGRKPSVAAIQGLDPNVTSVFITS